MDLELSGLCLTHVWYLTEIVASHDVLLIDLRADVPRWRP